MSRCAFTDAVIARHLDGDIAAEAELLATIGWQPGDFLGEHLRDCATCQQQLQRSRRLDAVIAEASGRATSDLQADPRRLQQMLLRATAVATTPVAAAAAGSAPRWPLWLRVASAVTLFAAGFAFALAIRPSPPPAPAVPMPAPGNSTPPPAVERVGVTVAASPGRTALPLARCAFDVPRHRAEAQQLAALLSDRALGDRLAVVSAVQFGALGSRSPGRASAVAANLRLRASQWLLDAAPAIGFDTWLGAVAGLDDDAALRPILADARRRPAVAARLCGRLQSVAGGGTRSLEDLAALTMAARLGGRELDTALRQLLRRANLTEELAAALRSAPLRDGRAALLLDIVGDRAMRLNEDEVAIVRTLFAGQPRAVVDELQQELRRARQLQRRAHCLLALGAVGGDVARQALLAAAQSPIQPEALTAGYALAQLSPSSLRTLLPQARDGEAAWIVRAALCCAGLPEATQWLDGIDLTETERALLAPGHCTLAQFPVLAGLLRDRAPAAF